MNNGDLTRLSKIRSLNLIECAEIDDNSRQKPMNVLNYITMSLILQIRDLFCSPQKILSEVGITPGICILDFGCGTGSFSVPSAEILERSGKVFALDLHPLAIDDVNQAVSKRKLTNVETILSDCETGLPSNSVDVILLYYTFHDLKNPDKVLHELHRVIKSNGILSFSEFNVNKISSCITRNGLFHLIKKEKHTHTFVKTS